MFAEYKRVVVPWIEVFFIQYTLGSISIYTCETLILYVYRFMYASMIGVIITQCIHTLAKMGMILKGYKLSTCTLAVYIASMVSVVIL